MTQRHPAGEAGGNPFLDPSRVRGDLYEDSCRLACRSQALLRAKVSGRRVPDVIVDLARQHLTAGVRREPTGRALRIVDVGCGRGASSLALRAAFPSAHLAFLDQSRDLLRAATARLRSVGEAAAALQADFHHLPLLGASLDLIVASFCLYHAPYPEQVIHEFARCLRDTGTAILVTKSEDSYCELDHLMVTAGLDAHATARKSLYETAHAGNIEALARSALRVERVEHERHTFRFDDLAHVAEYVATTPKYHLPPPLRGRSERITEALRQRIPDEPITTSSTVTYVVATRPGPHATGQGRAR